MRQRTATFSRPSPSVSGRQAAHEAVELVRPQIDRRPDVEQDAVPLQPLGRGAAGLEAADARQGLHQHVLELGELDDPAGGVAHRRQVAHLGDGEQPLVPGFSWATPWKRKTPSGAGRRSRWKFRSRQSWSRRAIMGWMPR